MKTRKMVVMRALYTGAFFAFDGVAQGRLEDGLVAWYPLQGNAENAAGPATDRIVSGATLTDIT